ncbi:Hydroxyacyl-CoA dehydrogenase/enoyl-CoA hydratase [Handroanthus impetiginosus]|uniref:Hydroxyacyl-CoA dehydrogenase/enoyl-CoA hydratase n=1 Tax=Handroanthus impetiginosus TaxID=429701 RepID=A0A2G9FXS9_9LAMI|nr:Hydroxyacyl-CoA dehydrogenase/enoyl-CoA hydratase [Handroanthus impetiginosus]
MEIGDGIATITIHNPPVNALSLSATPRTELGLPELKLGVIPGCGGICISMQSTFVPDFGLRNHTFMIRLVGVSKAVEMMLSSKIVSSEEGKVYGLIDSIVSSEELLTAARLWALDIVEGLSPRTSSLKSTEKLGSVDSSYEVLDNARLYAMKTFPIVPHYTACLDVVEEGLRFGGLSGVVKVTYSQLQEDKVFKELVLSTSAKGLVHAFLAERATSKVPSITDSGLSPRRIGKVVVISSGFMCSGIATALIISDDLQTLVVEGHLQPDKVKKAVTFLKGVLDYQEFQAVDMVIEAVDAEILLQQSIFEQLENDCSPQCILASTTSAANLSLIGERTCFKDRIVGVNFLSPAHVKPLLEIVQTKTTSKQVILDLIRFAKIIKKVPIFVKNATGFAVKRSFFPYTLGAEILANLGVDVFQIDRVITEFGMEFGPFQLQDAMGYQVYLKDVKEFAAAFPDRSFSSPLVQLMMESGCQAQRPFLSPFPIICMLYPFKPKPDLSVVEIIEKSAKLTNINRSEKPISVTDQEIIEMIFFPVVNEACRVLEEGIVAQSSDLDIASIHGMNFPSHRGGILFWGDTVGTKYIYSRLKNWCEIYGNFFKPSKLLEEKATKPIPSKNKKVSQPQFVLVHPSAVTLLSKLLFPITGEKFRQ